MIHLLMGFICSEAPEHPTTQSIIDFGFVLMLKWQMWPFHLRNTLIRSENSMILSCIKQQNTTLKQPSKLTFICRLAYIIFLLFVHTDMSIPPCYITTSGLGRLTFDGGTSTYGQDTTSSGTGISSLLVVFALCWSAWPFLDRTTHLNFIPKEGDEPISIGGR